MIFTLTRKQIHQLFLLALLLAAAGCTSASEPSEPAHQAATLAPASLGEGEKLRVVATTSIIADVVANVGRDLIDLTMLMPVGTDPHAFESRPEDVAAVADAHVLFANGLGLEEFLDPLLESAGVEGIAVHLSDGVDLLGAEGDWRENYPDYLGCCSSLDRNLGRIRKELKTLDIADDTVIFYASDHGSHFCTRNSEYKRSCHEGCIRVPLVACGPGFKGGRVIRELVSLIDLPPTLMQVCGADIPAGMRGRPLGDLVDGSARDWPEEVFLQISESQVGRALRTRSWKYSVVAPDKDGVRDAASDRYVEEFLYNLENDPHEKYNLVRHPFYRGGRAKLAAILKRRMAQAGEGAPVIEPAT